MCHSQTKPVLIWASLRSPGGLTSDLILICTSTRVVELDLHFVKTRNLWSDSLYRDGEVHRLKQIESMLF